MPPKTLYKILEIDTEASPDVIEAAYRRLARRYHPDLNSSADATARMQELNHAYAILRDSESRAEYDRELSQEREAASKEGSAHTSGHSTSTGIDPSVQYAQQMAEAAAARAATAAWAAASGAPVACQGCGRSDSTLRIASFPYVTSFIVFTQSREERGVYCESCRRDQMRKAKTYTAIAGWWGFPWGFFYTLGALLEPGSGKVDRDLNADYLRWLGGFFVNAGRVGEARRAFQASLEYRHDPELAQAVRNAFGRSAVDDPGHRKASNTSPDGSTPRKNNNFMLGGIVLTVTVLIVIGIVGATPWPPTPEPPGPSSGPSSGPTSTSTPQPTDVPPTPTNVVAAEWRTVDIAQGAVTVAVPSDWEVARDEEGFAVVSGINGDLVLFVYDPEEDLTAAQMIESMETSKQARDDYQQWAVDYLSEFADNQDGKVDNVDAPIVQRFGQVETMRVDAVLSLPEGSILMPTIVTLLMFDCAEFVCNLGFYRNNSSTQPRGEDAFLMKVVDSIKVN